jgi:hypothetical protein
LRRAGRFPEPWWIRDVEIRLLGVAPGEAEVLERLDADLPDAEEDVVLDLPISIHGGG